MPKCIMVTEQTVTVARPTRWEFYVVDHTRDKEQPEGTTRMDVVIHFGNVIPQQIVKNVEGMKLNGDLFSTVSDVALEAYAKAEGLTTEDDDDA